METLFKPEEIYRISLIHIGCCLWNSNQPTDGDYLVPNIPAGELVFVLSVDTSEEIAKVIWKDYVGWIYLGYLQAVEKEEHELQPRP